MTASAQGRTPPHLQVKATSTTQSSRLEAVADDGNTKATPQSHMQAKPARARPDVARVDYTSLPVTLSLIRRTLAPDKSITSVDARASPAPIDNLLPPLTSSNEIDLQLYAIVAIIIKDFVNTWYANITQDHTFIEEVIQIIAHCTRALEQKIRHTDIAALLLDEVPALVAQHVTTFRIATEASAQHRFGTDKHKIYHTLHPHPALGPISPANTEEPSSEQEQNEAIYRQLLVTGALAVLLPTEDLQNAPLRTLVGDVMADLIVGQALAGKICEGWFIHDTITKIVTVLQERIEPKASGQQMREDTKTRLEKFGLLNADSDPTQSDLSVDSQSRLTAWFWQVMQGIYLAILMVRFLVKGLVRARRKHDRSLTPLESSGSPTSLNSVDSSRQGCPVARPVLQYSLYHTLSTLFRLQDRMPWLTSTMAYWQEVLVFGYGRMAATNSVLDRFLHTTIQTHILPASIIPPILLNLRTALFPNNSLASGGAPPPSPAERLQIRNTAAEALLSLIPPLIARTYFDTSDHEKMIEQIEQDVLDPFGDAYMNKHLVYSILELLLCRLLPELTEGSISDLLAERGVAAEDEDKAGLEPVSVNSL